MCLRKEDINNPNFNSMESHIIKNEEVQYNRFTMTPKRWKENNPEIANKGNIREYADLIHLVILNNLENINAELIETLWAAWWVPAVAAPLVPWWHTASGSQT